ncbi:hypothetical protein [Pseudomonas putida]|uniref:DNA-directed RNA polymerase subunit beta n=1 Tax=Pseudomonas putida TaxID=303 RepID=A0A1L7NPZ2_PSEPU|nr:hypothetical protein [Pseudomonas putida]BAW27514.1 DNA-directed RNA polymerase subunit beta [Pseudomonas putida]
MVTASQVIDSIMVLYLGGCAIALAWLMLRRVFTAEHWHQVREIQQQSGLSPGLTAVMVINAIIYTVLRWPAILVRHIRYRLRGAQ